MTFKTYEGKITACHGAKNEDTIVIPDGITAISNNVFRGRKEIKKVVLPDSLREIGANAFADCTALEEVDFGDGLVRIGKGAFCRCVNLKTICLPDSVEEISNDAFGFCGGISELKLGSGLRKIGDFAFIGCNALRSVVLPEGLKHIGKSAFRLRSLETVNVPESVEYVGEYAFDLNPWYMQKKQEQEFFMLNSKILAHFCVDSERVEIPYGVKAILSHAFCDVKMSPKNGLLSEILHLRELILPDTVEVICEGAFAYTDLRKVTLGRNVRYIGAGAFAHCCELEEINFPESIEYIGPDAFNDTAWEREHSDGNVMANSHYLLYGDKQAEEIILPEGVREIAPFAFYKAKVKRLVLPSTVRSVGVFAFIWCYELESLELNEGLEELEAHSFSMVAEDLVIPSTVNSLGELLLCNRGKSMTHRLCVKLRFTVRESIYEVIRDEDKSFECHNIYFFAPHIPITAMERYKTKAALGFAKHVLEGESVDAEIYQGYKMYISERYKRFEKMINEYPFLLRFLCKEKLIPRSRITELLDRYKNDFEITAMLLEASDGAVDENYEL